MTSAATDLSLILDDVRKSAGISSDVQDTYVFGVSYGTLLVERLMQLAPPRVKGYILDSVISNSGYEDKKMVTLNDFLRHIFNTKLTCTIVFHE